MQPTRKITGIFVMRPLESVIWLLGALLILSLACNGYPRPARKNSTLEMWRLNLNAADSAQLRSLPGMTFRRTKALLAAREKRGGFEQVSDIAQIPGFSSAYVRRIQDLIDVKK